MMSSASQAGSLCPGAPSQDLPLRTFYKDALTGLNKIVYTKKSEQPQLLNARMHLEKSACVPGGSLSSYRAVSLVFDEPMINIIIILMRW
jgi:hypothetical protein